MTFRRIAAISLCLSLLAFDSTTFAAPPNVIVILSDDMGFSDLGCYGGEIDTPHLNRLAENGLRFTQFYNTARCCPTRASLLTGLYPHQAGVGHMTEDKNLPGYRGELQPRCRTIAETLKTVGYKNYAVGKWHVCRNDQKDGARHDWPLQRGFDRFYGTLTGAGDFYDPGTLTRDNVNISALADAEYKPEQYYYTDAISDHAVRFVEEHAKESNEKPFFLYVAYTAAHWPMHAKEADIAKYRGRYSSGYDTIRRARHEKSKSLGLIDPAWKLTPTVGDWENVKHREWQERCMETYAAMIDCMDQGVGRIVDSLKKTGKYEDTLVLYMQDNGGCAETVGRIAPTAAPKKFDPIPLDAYRTDVITKQLRDGTPVRTGPTAMPGPADTYIAYGEAWANVSNTPFRSYKHWVHEGGISTPLIGHWPRGIEEKQRGKLAHAPGHLIDIAATIYDLAGAKVPEEVAGVKIVPIEGTSLKPTFSGEIINRSNPIFWEHEGNRAVREDRWKLVAKGARGAWELYDMQTDRTETNDLAAQHPERVNGMAKAWQEWATRAHAMPSPWGFEGEQPAEKKTKSKRKEDAK